MSLRHLLSRWFGERITLTVAPEEFIVSVRDDEFRERTVVRVHEGKLTAIGEQAHAPDARGTLVSLFEGPRPTDYGWENEELCLMFLRHLLGRVNQLFVFNVIGPYTHVTVVGARRLRSVLRGQEQLTLIRLLDRAVGGIITFVDQDPAAGDTAPAA
jgi:hypothetical protein